MEAQFMAEEKLHTEIRREQIAEAALAIVAGQGVRRLSMAAVARRVGLVPSGIYRHFKDKAAMLDAVLDLLEKRIGDNVDAACQESDDPLEQLRGVLVRHVRFIREGRAIPRIIFSDDVHSGDPPRKQRIGAIIMGYAERLAEIIRRGQAQGTIRAAVDPSSAALMFFGMIAPAGMLWQLTEGRFDVTRVAERSWSLYRQMLTAEEVNAKSQGAAS
jgi:AcrR family transcriptional regulator